MKKIIWILMLSLGVSVTMNAQSFDEKMIDCVEGNAKACLNAGKIYSAQAHKEKDYDREKAASKVASLYKKSCNSGYAEGCTAYAMSYAADQEKNPHKDARYYFQKACDGGDTTGCTLLKMMPFGE
ncbi:sel1 repeat family protein [bacterium]|nr:sel1 repeat family protein [bacterium]